MTSSLPAGLRERKKAKTRTAIREHAMRLFEEQGYAATTIEAIAAAADVSQSTFFRYLPTKEDVVLSDDYDPLLVAALRAQPADLNPVAAIRLAFGEIFTTISDESWEQERRRQRLFLNVPELRGRALQQYADAIAMLAGVVAERAGLPPDDLSCHVLAGAVIGAVLAATPGGLMASFERRELGRVDEALRLLEAGLPLGPP
jgi:AcrR family transcriptional regulator